MIFHLFLSPSRMLALFLLGSGCVLCTAVASALARRARTLSLGTTTVALGLSIVRDDLHVGRFSSGIGSLLVWVLRAASAGTCTRGTRALSRFGATVACDLVNTGIM